MYKSYSEKLKDPRWQKKRLKILERDNWTCQICDSTDKTLHVHHKIYIAGYDPWEYDDDTLITYCEDCHEKETDAQKFDALITKLDSGASTNNRVLNLNYTLDKLIYLHRFVILSSKVDWGTISFRDHFEDMMTRILDKLGLVFRDIPDE